MRYWWVNHKQTFKQEFEGGYIWSPTRSNNGAFNQSYDNLTHVSANDIVISYAGGQIKAIGVAVGSFRSTTIPKEFGAKGNQWSKEGHLVNVNWFALTTPLRPKEFIRAIRDLLPSKYSPLQQNGNGNQGTYLAEVSADLAGVIFNKVIESNHFDWLAIQDFQNSSNYVIKDQEEETAILNEPLLETEKDQLIKARIGQGVFRNRVLKIEPKCRITGVSDPRFLITSHIKPWRRCDNHERVDGNNGLSLSPHIDKLFDKGWITFSDEGNLQTSSPNINPILKSWRVEGVNVGIFNKTQKEYLRFHREQVFRKCVRVTAGIIESDGRILIARRSPHKHLGGYWELPGGKIENDENPRTCLKRELLEELRIDVLVKEFIAESVFDYETSTVILLGYRVEYLNGDITLIDHDKFEWVSVRDVQNYKIAPADLPLLKAYARLSPKRSH